LARSCSAFHQPTVEPAAEAHLSTSLLRELEEELLGREELGNLFSSDFRKVDPFHTDLLSAPLRWLLEGFGCLPNRVRGLRNQPTQRQL
jgi:hypothetical protein